MGIWVSITQRGLKFNCLFVLYNIIIVPAVKCHWQLFVRHEGKVLKGGVLTLGAAGMLMGTVYSTP